MPAAVSEDAAKAILPLVAKTVGQFASERASLIRSQTDAWGGARRAAQDEFTQLVSKVRDEARDELAQKRLEQAEETRRGGLTIAVSYPPNYIENLFINIDQDDVDAIDISETYDGAPTQVAFPRLVPGFARVVARLVSGATVQDIAVIKADELSSLKINFNGNAKTS